MINAKDISKRLYYFSTFDGYLDNRGEGRNSRLSVTMVKENSDYIYSVAQALEDAAIGFKVWEPAINQHDGCNRRQQFRVQSKAHPKLTVIRNRIYIEGKKVIDPHMLTMLDAEALAIAFMADGSRKKIALANGETSLYRLHFNGFSYGDNYLICGAIKEKLAAALRAAQSQSRHPQLRFARTRLTDNRHSFTARNRDIGARHNLACAIANAIIFQPQQAHARHLWRN